VIRIFNLYFPTRTLLLLGGEATVICLSFLLAIAIRFGQDTVLVLNYESGFAKILAVTGLAILCSHYTDLYDLRRLRARGEGFFRLLVLVGVLSLLLGGLTYVFPQLLVGNDVFLVGLSILPLAWIGWRWAYDRLICLPRLRERVYVLGAGERAKRLVEVIRARPELGMDVVGWAGAIGNGSLTRAALGETLLKLARNRTVERVIVALADRRATMPVHELLQLRLKGMSIQDGTALLERISGQMEVEELYPSWLIFGQGFRLDPTSMMARRSVSILLSLSLLLITLPVIPLVILLVRLSSPGPVLYRQKRVGRNGDIFNCYKFRTMRPDAEADGRAAWASDDDPRITPVGHFLRKLRLDEIPQLWNVLKGDMSFVGPRPERPEFVERLCRELPFYSLRHVIRPGITGWAQINHGYGGSVEESKEKLRYDLYYLKNMSVVLDLLIVFQTIKTVLFGRGAR
jgi:sugar transferase (PEP-CTERM system associated)